jgi:tetratricopeptide (TPR) repeat protein
VQTASTAQVLAVGKAQLSLLQQAHYTLYPSVRPMHYSATYRLIGAALHFQGRYDEARQAHKNAYVAALEGGEAWNMAQSLTWQADGLKAQGQYTDAIQTIDAALRLVSQQKDIESIRLQAHLHASGAEIAAYMREAEGVQARLNASQALLENLPVHEEFDRTSWLQHAGACALILDQYDVAVRHLQQALDELPSHWTLRYATTLMPLVIALARSRQREACLAVAEKAIPIISAINAPSMNRQFVEYIQQEVLGAFPGDPQMSALASDAQQRLLPMKATASNS